MVEQRKKVVPLSFFFAPLNQTSNLEAHQQDLDQRTPCDITVTARAYVHKCFEFHFVRKANCYESFPPFSSHIHGGPSPAALGCSSLGAYFLHLRCPIRLPADKLSIHR